MNFALPSPFSGSLLEPEAIRAHNGPFGTVSRWKGVTVHSAETGLLLLFLAALPSAPPPTDSAVALRLIADWKDTDPDLRANLSQALAKIGPAAVEQLIAALADALPEPRAGTRSHSV